MDRKALNDEVSNLIANLPNEDETTKEYAQTVNAIVKLSEVSNKDRESDLKESRDDFDRKFRKSQLNFEKTKHSDDMEEKRLSREFEEKRLEYQHEETMARLNIEEIKAKNEETILKQNQEKAEKEFKSNRLKDILIFGGKVIMIGTIAIVYIKLSKDEMRLERVDMGILPPRSKNSNSMIGKLFSMIF